MSNFKVGDQVRFPNCNDDGYTYGEVTEVNHNDKYPVKVKLYEGQAGWVTNYLATFTSDGRYLVSGDMILELVTLSDDHADASASPSSRQDEEKAWLQIVSELIVKGMSAEYAVRQADTMIAEYRKRFGQGEGLINHIAKTNICFTLDKRYAAL